MSARALMVMGTGSDVGKSLIVAGFCRAFAKRGMKVLPFKPQNMSNNAAVTEDGGEIGRAQALQARAAGIPAVSAMNPVLLKPEGEAGSQLIVRGKRVGSFSARDYFATRQRLLPQVLAAFQELAAGAELVLVEGAGSAAEINLREGDIANFGFARAAGIPGILVGDIERGGAIASIVGTLQVIDPEDARLVSASLVNKFRGDPALFEAGQRMIEQRTGRPCFGPVPWFEKAHLLPAEDSLGLGRFPIRNSVVFHISVPRLPRIANFDDLDPLAAEDKVAVEIVPPGRPIPCETDLVILPGSKSTRADLAFLRAQGWHIDILAHRRAGGAVMGLCGGYQMLGREIADPEGLEGEAGITEGLGLLEVTTVLGREKELRLNNGVHVATGEQLFGYHMHLGVTDGPARAKPFARANGEPEGAMSADGLVMGTYLHGIFAADGFRRAFLAAFGARGNPGLDYEAQIETVLDELAAHLEAHLDLDAILALAREPGA